jgi:hypothetical protein
MVRASSQAQDALDRREVPSVNSPSLVVAPRTCGMFERRGGWAPINTGAFG